MASTGGPTFSEDDLRKWVEASMRIVTDPLVCPAWLVYAVVLLKKIYREDHPVYVAVEPVLTAELARRKARLVVDEGQALEPLVSIVRLQIPELDEMFGNRLPREVRRFTLSFLSAMATDDETRACLRQGAVLDPLELRDSSEPGK